MKSAFAFTVLGMSFLLVVPFLLMVIQSCWGDDDFNHTVLGRLMNACESSK